MGLARTATSLPCPIHSSAPAGRRLAARAADAAHQGSNQFAWRAVCASHLNRLDARGPAATTALSKGQDRRRTRPHGGEPSAPSSTLDEAVHPPLVAPDLDPLRLVRLDREARRVPPQRRVDPEARGRRGAGVRGEALERLGHSSLAHVFAVSGRRDALLDLGLDLGRSAGRRRKAASGARVADGAAVQGERRRRVRQAPPKWASSAPGRHPDNGARRRRTVNWAGRRRRGRRAGRRWRTRSRRPRRPGRALEWRGRGATTICRMRYAGRSLCMEAVPRARWSRRWPAGRLVATETGLDGSRGTRSAREGGAAFLTACWGPPGQEPCVCVRDGADAGSQGA